MSERITETTHHYFVAVDHRQGLVWLRFKDRAGTEIAMDAAAARGMAEVLNQSADQLAAGTKKEDQP